jgi:hypothetical protein
VAGKLKAAVGSLNDGYRGDADALYLSVIPLHQPKIPSTPKIDEPIINITDLDQSD